MRGWKKIFHANGDQKKTELPILISDKIDFKTKAVKKRQRRTLHNDQSINSLVLNFLHSPTLTSSGHATVSYLSITTLNANGLNAPTTRQRLAEWIQKQDLSTCCLQKNHLKTRDTCRLKVKGWKKKFHANGDQ